MIGRGEMMRLGDAKIVSAEERTRFLGERVTARRWWVVKVGKEGCDQNMKMKSTKCCAVHDTEKCNK